MQEILFVVEEAEDRLLPGPGAAGAAIHTEARPLEGSTGKIRDGRCPAISDPGEAHP